MGRIFLFEKDNKESQSTDSQINGTIKPVDRVDSNAEIEKGELVLNPDMGGLWKATGQRHSKGGTPVYLQDESFIFSNDKSLAISQNEKDLFDIKDTVEKLKNNTPAALLSRMIKPKDYNSLVNVMGDENSDKLSMDSASLMLKKHMETIGKIGYIQEAKKGEPTPEFSVGTAPVYDDELKIALDVAKNYKLGGYFQVGGRFRNPFNWRETGEFRSIYGPDAYSRQRTGTNMNVPYVLPDYPGMNDWMNVPGAQGAQPPIIQDPTTPPVVLYQPPDTLRPNTQRALGQTRTAPSQSVGIQAWPGDETTGVDNKSIYSTDQWRNLAKQLGFKGNNNLEFQNYLMNNTTPEIRQTIQGLHEKYGDPFGGMFDGKLGHRWDVIFDQLSDPEGNIKVGNLIPPPDYNVGTPQPSLTQNPVTEQIKQSNQPTPSYNKPNIRPYNPSVPLSPLQGLNLMYAAGLAMSVPKYFPMRPQISSPLVELERINAQPILNQIDNAAYQAYAANSTLNPVLQAANNAATFGRTLDAKSQAMGNVLNQNVQIGNQQNMVNNQIQRQDLQQNISYNQQYYDSVQRTNQNFQDERRGARNNALGLFNQYMSQNDALAAKLQSQRMYTKPVLDANGNQVMDKNGNPVLQQSPLFDLDTRGWTPRVYYTGAGDISQIPQRPNTMSLYNQAFQSVLASGVDRNTAAVVAGRIAADKDALQNSVQTYRKGGKYRKK